MSDGHEKLFKVILNQKVGVKFNYQELEELNFALTDRFQSLKKKGVKSTYLKFIKKIIMKIRAKIDAY